MRQEEKKIEDVDLEFQQAEPPELDEATLQNVSGGMQSGATNPYRCGGGG